MSTAATPIAREEMRPVLVPTIESYELAAAEASDSPTERNVIDPPPLRAPVGFLHLGPSEKRCSMNLAGDLDHFAEIHRAHGSFAARVGDVTPNGYRLKVSCACGVTLERWVTQEDGIDEVLRERLRVQPT